MSSFYFIYLTRRKKSKKWFSYFNFFFCLFIILFYFFFVRTLIILLMAFLFARNIFFAIAAYSFCIKDSCGLRLICDGHRLFVYFFFTFSVSSSCGNCKNVNFLISIYTFIYKFSFIGCCLNLVFAVAIKNEKNTIKR